ncbi:hypothetical protein COHA_007357 [Chlorella ohadii]|uniref:Uncharacterized protein n=1 Tax=Chlorella ohadii TaxID=2649997 RepID=A0AAD5DJ00_9CHLO|nr:hypothetical protein COHA_007357 [Chlorella ohadii]
MFYSEPALWQSLELTAASLKWADAESHARQWFAAKASLLRRVGGFVQHLRYSQVLDVEEEEEEEEEDEEEKEDSGMLDMQQLAADCGIEWQLGSSVLAHLSPTTLQSLHLQYPSWNAEAAAALERFSRLTKLILNCWDDLPSCAVAALPSLPQLLSLELSGLAMPGLATALRLLTRLTQLDCYSLELLPPLSILFPLTRLRQLEWTEQRQSGLLEADLQQLVRLPCLERWRICSDLDTDVPSVSLQVGGAVLAYCAVKGRTDGTVQELRLGRIEYVPSLHQLMAAALPAGTLPSQLRSLDIFHSRLPLPAVLGCPFLGHLNSLKLHYCTFEGGGAAPVVEALLQQAPRLQSLAVQHCFPYRPFPAALMSRTGVQHLSLSSNLMTELPPGPYLSSLTSLDLNYNCWNRVPQALTAATNLIKLSLAGNDRLTLNAEDVDIVLRRLRRLRWLYLDLARMPADVLNRLRSALLQLAILDH